MFEDALNVDLNALRTFRHVYRRGSFSAAADDIGVKQSTVSYTIDRLRKSFDDPLFMRQGGKNIPTARCVELISMVDRILAEADNMRYQDKFDPSKATGHLSVICSSYGMRILFPKVFQRVRKEAPNIRLDFTQRFQGVAQLLLEGSADIALTFSDIDMNGIKSHKRVTTDFPVCVMDPANPLVGKHLSIEDMSRSKHIGAELWKNWKQPYMSKAEEMGAKIEVVSSTTDQAHTPTVLLNTNLIGGMPSRLAQTFGSAIGIAYFPFKLEIVQNMYWAAASDRSPLHRWLRNTILEETSKLPPLLEPEL